jgi:hypothetical protein
VSGSLDTRRPGRSPDEEFLDRFGDAIDDRIAETMDELLEQRKAAGRHRRLPRLLICVSPVLGALGGRFAT